MRKIKSKNKGFSLIEMLIAIAISSIVFTMLFNLTSNFFKSESRINKTSQRKQVFLRTIEVIKKDVEKGVEGKLVTGKFFSIKNNNLTFAMTNKSGTINFIMYKVENDKLIRIFAPDEPSLSKVTTGDVVAEGVEVKFEASGTDNCVFMTIHDKGGKMKMKYSFFFY